MSNPIIQLRNKHKDEVTDPLQVDMSSDSAFFSDILNTLFSRESNYVFYYKNERLVQNLDGAIRKHNLSIEHVIQIDYIDEEDMECDFSKDCSDTIVGVEWFGNSLFYVTYRGLVFSLNDTLECSLSGIKGIFCGKRLFGFSSHSVYDIEENREIYRFEEEIRSCGASNDGTVAVAADDKIFLLRTDHLVDSEAQKSLTIATLGFPRSVFLSDHVVYWAEDYNKVSFYDIERDTKKTISCGCAINNLLVCGARIFGTTANSKIVVISGDGVEEKEISLRLSNHIRMVGNVILYSTQHEIIGLNCDNLQEISFFRVSGQINGVASSDEMVYVANNQKISGFLKSRLVSSSRIMPK